jgi:hypothetical protein
MYPSFAILGTCKGQSWGEARALFCRKSVEAQEARDQQDGIRSKIMEVEPLITQTKEWL